MVDDPGVAESETLWGLLARRAEMTPDRPMLLDEHDRRVTFAEFTAWAERVAAGLHRRGIGAGTAVTWQLPTRIETVVLSMALARLGAVQNPIIHLYRERELGFLLRVTGAELVAVPRVWSGFDYEAMVHGLLEASDRPFEVLVVDDGLPEGDPAELARPPTDGDEVRWLYSTSGTTSEPKAVRHTDGSLIAGGVGIAVALGLTADDICSMPFPYAHIGGPDQLVMILRCGAPVLLLERFVPSEAVEVLNRNHVTITGGSTAHYLALLQEQRKQPGERLMPALRMFCGGGAPKPPELYWQVKQEMGVEIRHGYGMTECPMIANGALGDSDEQLAESEGGPVRGCEIRVVGADGSPVRSGVDGDIQVRGPMVTKGYMDPALDREAFVDDGFLRTGDRGYLRDDGHIVLTGRSKELIIRKGENISPREIEDVLIAHPKVAAIAVIGLPDAARGERVCAVVETRLGQEALTFPEMQDACRAAGLMTQKHPEQLELVDALPRNPTMKILKRVLVERFGQEAEPTGEAVARSEAARAGEHSNGGAR